MRLEMVALFRGLTEHTRHAVSALAVEESHQKGSFLFHSGDPARHLYVLEQGRVRLQIGETTHLAVLHCDAGEIVGWTSMSGHSSYTASAECVDAVTVLKFDSTALADLLEKDPVSGMNFYRGLTEIIGRRLVAAYAATVSIHGQRDPKYWG
jgi:CRP-like cAMP-binding protein